jgi:hypothetical protein
VLFSGIFGNNLPVSKVAERAKICLTYLQMNDSIERRTEGKFMGLMTPVSCTNPMQPCKFLSHFDSFLSNSFTGKMPLAVVGRLIPIK